VATTQAQILDAIEAMLSAGLTAASVTFARNDTSVPDLDTPDRVTMFDGEPGQPIEQLLGSRLKTYRHEIPLDIFPVQAPMPEARAHAIRAQILALIDADRTLGGLVDDLDLSELAGGLAPVSEARALKFGSATLIAEYTL